MPTVVDVLNETRLTLSQAAKLLPGPDGGQASRQAVRRWVADGVKLDHGVVKLEAKRVGGRWFTSKEAVARFIDAQNPADPAAGPGVRTPAAATRASKAAEKELIRRGC